MNDMPFLYKGNHFGLIFYDQFLAETVNLT